MGYKIREAQLERPLHAVGAQEMENGTVECVCAGMGGTLSRNSAKGRRY
ncbi:MAG: hypothetical protein ACLRZH_03765 [Ruthenibacterium lactatiformans]